METNVANDSTDAPVTGGAVWTLVLAFSVLASGCSEAVVGGDFPAESAAGPAPVSELIFGLGPEADSVIENPLLARAPLWMLSSWYNGPDDLAWITGWQDDLIPRRYAEGYALHLIVAVPEEEAVMTLPDGAIACGRTYPLSDGFLNDMALLAQTFAGETSDPPLLVTLFSGFPRYGCGAEGFEPDPETRAYFEALRGRYSEARVIFRSQAPNARVSLGWAGGQTRSDDPVTGAGRSMLGYFESELSASEFQSFHALDPESNVEDVRQMVEALGRFGPVMLSHYKPSGGAQELFAADAGAMLNDTFLAEAWQNGLFAWSFLDAQAFPEGSANFGLVEAAVTRYGRAP